MTYSNSAADDFENIYAKMKKVSYQVNSKPFTTYSNSAADVFENIYAKMKKFFHNEQVLALPQSFQKKSASGKGLTLSDASCSRQPKQAISPFVTLFSTLFNNHIFIYVDFPFLCQDVFNVVCKFLLCEKGLRKYK